MDRFPPFSTSVVQMSRLLSDYFHGPKKVFFVIFQRHFFKHTSKMIKDHAMPSRSFVSGSNWRSQLIAMTGAYLANMMNHSS